MTTTTTTTTTSTTTTTTTAVCSAIDGPAAGSACVFPFNFMGVLHFGCTTIDGDSPWCSTQTDYNDNHVSGVGAWGYCDASCPIQETADTTTMTTTTTTTTTTTAVCSAIDGPAAGSACVFPFKFMGVLHF